MFHFSQTSIDGVLLIEPEVYSDSRGCFFETFSVREFKENKIIDVFVQSNHSTSSLGVLRGMHFQRQHPQSKLVRVASGAVFDVAVDLRPSSKSYGCYFGTVLSGDNKHMLYIPTGCAHGFLTLTDDTEFIYQCSDYYFPQYESGICYNDSKVDIHWPFEPCTVSRKDKALPTLEEVEQCGYL